MLRMAGLPAENIHVSDLDTKTHPDCFSYRNEGRKTGEHFTFGWIESAMLRMAGLPAENIHVSDLDTKTHPDCFSYRNEGRKTGEHFTFGWIESTDPGTGAS